MIDTTTLVYSHYKKTPPHEMALILILRTSGQYSFIYTHWNSVPISSDVTQRMLLGGIVSLCECPANAEV